MSQPQTCRICGAKGQHDLIRLAERMFDSGEVFDYFACHACGTLQIAEIPEDLARFYDPGRYYSFLAAGDSNPLRLFVKRQFAAHMVGRPERYPQGSDMLSRLRGGCEPWIATVPGLSLHSRILDVGCGNGARLETLSRLGFTSLGGIDKFLPEALVGQRPGGVSLWRGDLAEHDGTYDLIMMHHSLEHVPAPHMLLAAARERLAPGGTILVRIPVLQPDIWARYGVNWVQLDPPRHLYLFTPGAFRDLAERTGLGVASTGTDTMPWSLMWSEAYARGMNMVQPDGSPTVLPFDRKEAAAFAREAAALNAVGKGDQAYFVLHAA